MNPTDTQHTVATDLAGVLVRAFAAVDDVLQDHYEHGYWMTPNLVAEELATKVAARIRNVIDGDGSRDLVGTLSQVADALGRHEPLDPWEVLAFRAPIDVRSHRVVLTDPPELSDDVRAVQARLLRRGVAVLSDETFRGQRTVELSSYVEEWAYEAARELLPGVDVAWVAQTPREIKPARSVSWRDKGENHIRVWIEVGPGEHVDDVLAAEDDESVVVLAYTCTPAAGAFGMPHHEPAGIYLERPVGDRVVVDGFSHDPIPDEDSLPSRSPEERRNARTGRPS